MFAITTWAAQIALTSWCTAVSQPNAQRMSSTKYFDSATSCGIHSHCLCELKLIFMLRLGNEESFPWEEKVSFRNKIPNSTSFSIYLLIFKSRNHSSLWWDLCLLTQAKAFNNICKCIHALQVHGLFTRLQLEKWIYLSTPPSPGSVLFSHQYVANY